MQINYDRDLKVAGIGIVPWSRLGPEQWLPNYKIASFYNWDLKTQPEVPAVFSLNGQSKLQKINTWQLLKNDKFQELLAEKLNGYSLLTYKPVLVPENLAAWRFLADDQSFLKKYENKYWFRQHFQKVLSFPDHRVFELGQLEATKKSFTKMLSKRPAVVLQDELLSGGKGTFVMSNYDQYCLALKQLQALPKDRKIIVSAYIDSGRDRSLQACVTKFGVFTGPLQRQIVGDPLLVNDKLATEKFAGASILAADQDSLVHQKATTIAKKIGLKLQTEGYRGIFGVDYLLDAANNLFVLEVNARLTGVTPLLTELNRGYQNYIPFYLLHILELSGSDYSIDNSTVDYSNLNGSLLLIHHLGIDPVWIVNIPKSGTYTIKAKKLTRLSDNLLIHNLKSSEFVIQQYMPVGSLIKPGGRLVNLMFSQSVIDGETDKLYNATSHIINVVRQNITVVTEAG